MKTKSLTYLLALSFLFLFSGSVFGDSIQDGIDAYERDDKQTAKKILVPFAEGGNEVAQYYLGMMLPFSSEKRLKWFTLSANQGVGVLGGQPDQPLPL